MNVESKNDGCQVCGKPCRVICTVCHGPSYCGVECQSTDWEEHQRVCNFEYTKAANTIIAMPYGLVDLHEQPLKGGFYSHCTETGEESIIQFPGPIIEFDDVGDRIVARSRFTKKNLGYGNTAGLENGETENVVVTLDWVDRRTMKTKQRALYLKFPDDLITKENQDNQVRALVGMRRGRKKEHAYIIWVNMDRLRQDRDFEISGNGQMTVTVKREDGKEYAITFRIRNIKIAQSRLFRFIKKRGSQLDRRFKLGLTASKQLTVKGLTPVKDHYILDAQDRDTGMEVMITLRVPSRRKVVYVRDLEIYIENQMQATLDTDDDVNSRINHQLSRDIECCVTDECQIENLCSAVNSNIKVCMSHLTKAARENNEQDVEFLRSHMESGHDLMRTLLPYSAQLKAARDINDVYISQDVKKAIEYANEYLQIDAFFNIIRNSWRRKIERDGGIDWALGKIERFRTKMESRNPFSRRQAQRNLATMRKAVDEADIGRMEKEDLYNALG